MNTITSILGVFLLFVIPACGKIKKISIQNEHNSNCYDVNSNVKISNGCAVDKKNVQGADSVVLLQVKGSVCSGTVISEHFVLTAAHCVYDKGFKSFPVSTVFKDQAKLSAVVIGNNPEDIFSAKRFAVEKIIPNGIYYNANVSKMSHLGDIALIKTKQSLLKNSSAKVMRLKATPVPLNTSLISIGFGKVNNRNGQQFFIKRWSAAQYKAITVSAQHDYNNQYSRLNLQNYPDQIHPSFAASPAATFLMTSAETPLQGQTCGGDSGGPQVYHANGVVSQVSITTGLDEILQKEDFAQLPSQYDDCVDLRSSINTQIASYLDWIKSELAEYGEIPDIED